MFGAGFGQAFFSPTGIFKSAESGNLVKEIKKDPGLKFAKDFGDVATFLDPTHKRFLGGLFAPPDPVSAHVPEDSGPPIGLILAVVGGALVLLFVLTLSSGPSQPQFVAAPPAQFSPP